MPLSDIGIATIPSLERITERPQAEFSAKEVGDVFCELRMPVFRYLASILQNPSLAEELTQEAFVRFLLQVRDGKPIHNVRVWIFRVARNLALDSKRSRRRLSLLGPSVESIAPSPEQLAMKSEQMNQYEQNLKALSPQERHCFELRNEGLVYREIGEVLGIRVSSVATFISRAIEKLSFGMDRLSC